MSEVISGVIETARAKINLSLRVLGRRADGYHELGSLVVFAGVGDRLSFEAADNLSLEVTGPFGASLHDEAENLVLRAARALRAASGCAKGAHIILDKRLPVASGIGGGSADAAATLRGLARLWGVSADLEGLALGLGADVPVCLESAPVLMEGIGERLRPVPPLPPLHLVLVNPGIGVSTARVFGLLAAPALSARLPVDSLWREGGFPDWLAARPNDLEGPSRKLCPEIGGVIEALAATKDCLLARMSGSGATCFGLYAGEGAAQAAAQGLRARYRGWWIVATGTQ